MNERFNFRVWDDTIGAYWKEGTIQLSGNGQPFIIDGNMQPQDIENVIIEQCTGLKDKNGKLIFEGDIVKPTDPEFRGLYVVKWNEKTYAFDFQKVNGFESQKFYYLYSDDVVIVGNIHDNA